MKRVLAAVLALSTLAAPALAATAEDGTYRCSARDRTPMGVFVITAPTYEYTVVSGTEWTPVEGDPLNGVGDLDIADPEVTATSGPLFDLWAAHGRYSYAESAHSIRLYYGTENLFLQCIRLAD